MREKKPASRPTVKTPENREKILRGILAGMRPYAAAVAAGIGERTYREWYAEDEDLQRAVEMADAQCHQIYVEKFTKSIGGSWRGLLAFLERRWPEDWKKRIDITTKDKPLNDAPVQKIDFSELGDEDLEQLERLVIKVTKPSGDPVGESAP